MKVVNFFVSALTFSSFTSCQYLIYSRISEWIGDEKNKILRNVTENFCQFLTINNIRPWVVEQNSNISPCLRGHFYRAA